MENTFKKREYNRDVIDRTSYIDMFKNIGFIPKKVDLCFTNGLSAYISLEVNVINEDKMWADVFILDGVASIQVRVSDHDSNLEKICGGVCGNKMSLEAFNVLVENNVIS